MPSSWKEESSTTHVFGTEPLPFAPAFVANAIHGVPKFPQAIAAWPAALRSAAASAVVVDLPFVPVIPTTTPGRTREASSISETTGIARARRVEDGEREGDARRHDDQVDAVEQRQGVSAELPAHALERRQFAELLRVIRVRPDDGDAALGERRHRRPAGAREAEDRRGADLGQVGAEVERHRSFNDPSAMSAKRIATIQKRMMTFDSGQPRSSKW
jgi:hypothetical protein